jgi:hypothetical protein
MKMPELIIFARVAQYEPKELGFIDETSKEGGFCPRNPSDREYVKSFLLNNEIFKRSS